MEHSTHRSPLSQPSVCPALSLTGQQRQQLAVHALAGTQSITVLAGDCQVSRKFVYRQANIADRALEEVFCGSPEKADVLFHLPVTKAWLRQLILGLTLHCHSSFRGAQALLDDVFDTSLSLGTIHNIVHDAATQARQANAQPSLSRVRIGAHDEIFQNGRPVLVGVDTQSTYCYLLSLEDHRDAETWGLHLLELQKQGLNPEATIADGGRGFRAGHAIVWPDVPCRADVFHALYDVGQLASYLENRAYNTLDACDKEERRMARARRRGCGKNHASKLTVLRKKRDAALELAEEVALLACWLRQDVLAVAGPDYATRCQLFDFLLAELEAREASCPHRISPLVRELKNQRDNLLAFAADLDQRLAAIAREHQVLPSVTREFLLLGAMPPQERAYWIRESELRQQLGKRFFAVQQAVASLAKKTVRASSLVENVNSRLRNYFFLRRHLGPDYLDLLQFFLNHRRFPRSQQLERVGKSPADLLTGQPHAHWLELLGYQRFQHN